MNRPFNFGRRGNIFVYRKWDGKNFQFLRMTEKQYKEFQEEEKKKNG